MRGGDGDEDDEFNNNFTGHKSIQVVLKILDQSHKDIALVSPVIFVLHPKDLTVLVYFLVHVLVFVFLRHFLKLQV